MTKHILPPVAKKIPVQLEKHGDIRTDDYFWMKERDAPEVLDYLNQENGLLPSHVYEFIADKQNGFVTFFISDKKLQEMIDDVFNTGGEPPVNKMRKIIFKDYCGLTPSEKMSIVGRLIGRSSRVDAEAIYQAMLDISYKYENITWSKIAGLLDCSTRTVQRNLTKQLRDDKEILNMENEKI